MSQVALSFSYNGYHRKSTPGMAPIDPIKHLQMLIAAIDNANPRREHDVIVSAIGFDIWSMPYEERMLGLEVYKRSKMVLSWNGPMSHQDGAACSIRMATEYAAAIGAKYMIHLAEDVLVAPDFVDYFLRHLADADYVGSHWIMMKAERRPISLNTQVFGCRIAAFVDFKRNRFVIPFTVTELETEIYKNIKAMGLKYKVGATAENLHLFPEGRAIPYAVYRGDDPVLYEHTHDPDEFRKLFEARGGTWCTSPSEKIAKLRAAAVNKCVSDGQCTI